jgi:Ca2+-binding RTX toxin-like protein
MRSPLLRTATAVALAAGLGGALLAPGPAQADAPARVFITSLPAPALVFTASGDHTDRVTFRPHLGGVEIEDPGTAIVIDEGTERGCYVARVGLVRCPAITGISSVTAALGDGNDSFTNKTALPAHVNGGSGNDEITGGSVVDYLDGADGNDNVYGGGGNDTLRGGAHSDNLWGGDGDDDLEGDGAVDHAYGDDGNDTMNSAYGDDVLRGGNGNDDLVTSIDVYGDGGDDKIVMKRNSGEYWGGAGFDTIDYSAWSWVRVSLNGNDDDKGGAPGDGQHNVHGDVDAIMGTPGDDDMTGHDSRNEIMGGRGSDTIRGKGGNDILNVGVGVGQEIDGGDGDDVCVGFDIVRLSRCE